MTKLRFILLLLLLALAGGRVDAALSGAEKKAFEGPQASFRFGVWDRAEKELTEFIRMYPESERILDAVLWLAQAQHQQGKYAAAEQLLQSRLEQAGEKADEFWYWLAQAQFAATNYTAAVTSFGKLARDFPASPFRLEAAVSEAAALGKLGRWNEVVETLQREDGAFRLSQVQAVAGNEWLARGFLLLAEAQLTQKDYAAAETALRSVGEKLSPNLDWQRRHLLSRTLAESGRLDEAVRETAELIEVAKGTDRWEAVSDSVVFHAELLEKVGRWADAIRAWQLNFTNAPVARQREALMKATALAIQQDRTAEALTTLEKFVREFTNAPAADVAWLTLGELRLKQHVREGATNRVENASTNRLTMAMEHFQRVLKNYPGSAFVGNAQLNLGWCFWVQDKWTESEAAFTAAMNLLPVSKDRVVAQLKLADAQFVQANYPAALENYQAVLLALNNWPDVKSVLRTPAAYQALRASLALNNAAGAEQAMNIILAGDAPSDEAVGSILLVAQSYLDTQQAALAQKWFDDFIVRFPSSTLRPEVEVLVAQLQEEQGEWTAAAAAYDEWLEQYPTHRLRPQVEFQRALTAASLGQETNALQRLTNFVAQYRQHELAPRAQWWVAEWNFQQGHFQAAEIGFKELINNWPQSDLANEARLMAGRAALGRSGYDDAIEHFQTLVNDTNCPTRLWIRAMTAYGGTLQRKPPPGTNKLENIERALLIYRNVVNRHRTNALVAAVWGEIGNCAFTLSDFPAAIEAYQTAANFTNANLGVRCRAKVGWAEVLEKQAQQLQGDERMKLLAEARNHLLDVYLGKLGDVEDVFWKKKAGQEAAWLSEVLREWPQAVEIYRDMLQQNLLPRSYLEGKIGNALDNARRQQQASGGAPGTKI